MENDELEKTLTVQIYLKAITCSKLRSVSSQFTEAERSLLISCGLKFNCYKLK